MWKLGFGDAYFLDKGKSQSLSVDSESINHYCEDAVAADYEDSDNESQAWNVI
jgi:hypothetical protein